MNNTKYEDRRLVINLDKEINKKFRVWCAQNDIKMSHQIEKLIRDFLKDKS